MGGGDVLTTEVITPERPTTSSVPSSKTQTSGATEKIGSRGGKNTTKRAVIAVARKLSVLLHRLWVTAEVYKLLYNASRRGDQAA